MFWRLCVHSNKLMNACDISLNHGDTPCRTEFLLCAFPLLLATLHCKQKHYCDISLNHGDTPCKTEFLLCAFLLLLATLHCKQKHYLCCSLDRNLEYIDSLTLHSHGKVNRQDPAHKLPYLYYLESSFTSIICSSTEH